MNIGKGAIVLLYFLVFLPIFFIVGIIGSLLPTFRKISAAWAVFSGVAHNVLLFSLIILVLVVGLFIALYGYFDQKRDVLLMVHGLIGGGLAVAALWNIKQLDRFSLMLLFAFIYVCASVIIVYILSSEKKTILKKIGAFVFLVIAFMPAFWIIGYDLNYAAIVSQENVAYYYCEGIYYTYPKYARVGEPVKSIRRSGYIFSEPYWDVTAIIGEYGEGDYITPNCSAQWVSDEEITYYPVYTEDGQSGYVPNTKLQVFYCAQGDWVEQQRSIIINNTWYKFCPEFFLNIGCKVFSLMPLGYNANIETNPALYR